MSRTTTEDCQKHCPNHFNLAYHASQRALQILRRGDPKVNQGDDRSVVVALREIAAGFYNIPQMAAEKPPVEPSADNAEYNISQMVTEQVAAENPPAESSADDAEYNISQVAAEQVAGEQMATENPPAESPVDNAEYNIPQVAAEQVAAENPPADNAE